MGDADIKREIADLCQYTLDRVADRPETLMVKARISVTPEQREKTVSLGEGGGGIERFVGIPFQGNSFNEAAADVREVVLIGKVKHGNYGEFWVEEEEGRGVRVDHRFIEEASRVLGPYSSRPQTVDCLIQITVEGDVNPDVEVG